MHYDPFPPHQKCHVEPSAALATNEGYNGVGDANSLANIVKVGIADFAQANDINVACDDL
ncbi:MAG: hypothetical protein EOP22_14585 [Hyphomicrobiales bacterium]|nr:MAG: hypothetical protein EOP22_14585 [Hyphomicrobiales bacterium]